MNKLNQKNNILFSVVLCTYNRGAQIKTCLESLINQDFPKHKYEIIVVDDGSSDNTVAILKEFPITIVEHEKNKGVAAARNTGLKHAQGKVYVCFDDDCYADKSWLNNLAKVYDKFQDKDLAGVAGYILLQNSKGIIDKYMFETGYANPSPPYYVRTKGLFGRFFSYIKNMFSPHLESKQNIFEVGEIWGANCSFPVEVLRKVNGWDESLSGVEDTDLCNKIQKEFPNKRYLCTKDAVLYHDHLLSLTSLFLKPFKRGPAILRFYQKNNKIPPFFPFPILISLSTLLAAFYNPLLLLGGVLLLPHVFYSWWVMKAIKKKQAAIFLFPYLQAGYELFSVLGLLLGIFINLIKITPRKILLILLLLGILTNFLIINNISFYYFREIFSSIYLLFTSGLLLGWILRINYKSISEFITHTLGLSIVFLMTLGLLINYILPIITTPQISVYSIILPAIHITKPLIAFPTLMSINIILLIIWICIFVSNIQLPISKTTQISVIGIFYKTLLLLLPTLSILGAISLNNHGSNLLTMIMLGMIAFVVLLFTIFRDVLPEYLFPYSIFTMALSLLFMTSLRGWYITGHDIFLEYFVFQLTKAHGIWQMTNFQDPYNACLSITILPTMLSSITHINDFYIYKTLYQIIFSTSIVTTFMFIRKFLHPFLAFLGSFIIISLPTFMTDMPMLNRQEIALVFFALILYTLFNNNISQVKKWILFVLFSIGLLFSHYSTTYITAALLTGTFLLHIPFRMLHVHNKLKSLALRINNTFGFVESKPNLKLGMVIILLIATITWSGPITNTATGITTTIKNISKDIQTMHVAKSKSDPGSYGLLTNKKPTTQQLLQQYVQSLTIYVRKFNKDTAFFNSTIFTDYPVTVGAQVKQPLTFIGQYLSNLHINVFKINDELKQIYARIMQLFIVMGLIAVFFLKKHLSNFQKEYYFFTITFFGILVIETILPSSAIDYGILRLFQQGMMLFSIPLLMGGLAIFSIFNSLHKSIKYYLLSIVLVFFFLYLSGFIPQLTGGYYPQLNLANAGFYYDAYYTHTQDIFAMNWLSENRDIKIPVQSDWFTLKKIHTYEGFYSIDGMIPSVIRKNSYVYLSASNTSTGQVIIYANGAPLYYKYNENFLNDNKNLIYSNGQSKIYR